MIKNYINDLDLMRIKSTEVNKKFFIELPDLFHIIDFVNNTNKINDGIAVSRKFKGTSMYFFQYMQTIHDVYYDLDEVEIKKSIAREILFLIEDELGWTKFSKYCSNILGIIDAPHELLRVQYGLQKFKYKNIELSNALDNFCDWSFGNFKITPLSNKLK